MRNSKLPGSGIEFAMLIVVMFGVVAIVVFALSLILYLLEAFTSPAWIKHGLPSLLVGVYLGALGTVLAITHWGEQ